MEASNAPISSRIPGILDTTSRSICTTFEKYIYLYEVSAQLSRIVYCDSGFIKKLMTTFGSENATVMSQIHSLDKEFKSKRGIPLEAQNDRSLIPGIPHESYALGHAHTGDGAKYGTYISTPEVLTALILDSSVKKDLLAKGPFQEKDILLSFKGTSTFAEVVHDLKSVITRSDLSDVLQAVGIRYEERGSILNGAFTGPLLRAWDILIRGLTEHSEKYDSFRLFCIGHSLGGAYCTLFGFLLGLIKELPASDSPTVRLVKRISSIHILSLGSPTICSDKARNVFNSLLDKGVVTLDRLVTQVVPTLTAHGVGTDIVPTIPALFSHPGYKPSAVSLTKDPNRPYSLTDIYKVYGTGIPKKYLVEATQTGGFGKYKGEYSSVLSKRSSNFISMPAQGLGGSMVPHLVYLGMRYLSSLRLPGWKNPVPPKSTKCAYFGLYHGDSSEGVDIQYVECGRAVAVPVAGPVAGAVAGPLAGPVAGPVANRKYTRKIGKHVLSLLLGGAKRPRKSKKISYPSFRQKCRPLSRK